MLEMSWLTNTEGVGWLWSPEGEGAVSASGKLSCLQDPKGKFQQRHEAIFSKSMARNSIWTWWATLVVFSITTLPVKRSEKRLSISHGVKKWWTRKTRLTWWPCDKWRLSHMDPTYGKHSFCINRWLEKLSTWPINNLLFITLLKRYAVDIVRLSALPKFDWWAEAQHATWTMSSPAELENVGIDIQADSQENKRWWAGWVVFYRRYMLLACTSHCAALLPSSCAISVRGWGAGMIEEIDLIAIRCLRISVDVVW